MESSSRVQIKKLINMVEINSYR